MVHLQNKWVSISLFNLFIVSFLGCLLRYKIAYSLPIINQKYLLNAHSHFAFSGWVTMALMILMVKFLEDISGTLHFKKYQLILWFNLLSAIGMLLTFPFQGYAIGSIIFSTLSIFASYFFAIKFWKDVNCISKHHTATLYFKAALIFNVLSSLGAFSLAYMLATKNLHQDFYLACIYFFLHFQYNGWFFFACTGLLSYRLILFGVAQKSLKKVFWLFAGACIPAYFLSALWIPMPQWVYVLVVIAVIAQLVGWGILINSIKPYLSTIKTQIPLFGYRLFSLVALAFTIKLLLQGASSIPSLSFYTYGFRPIVIGYLHLVLLGVISLFIIAYIVSFHFILLNKQMKKGIIVFVIGIILNEVFLMMQGIADLRNEILPFMNEALLGAAFVLFFGLLIMNIAVKFE